MAEPLQVRGTLRKIEKRFYLIPDAELHPELQGVSIFCKNRLGPDQPKVRDGQHETFLVQPDEQGGAIVIGIVPSAGSERRSGLRPDPVGTESQPTQIRASGTDRTPGSKTATAAPAAAAPRPSTPAARDTFIHPYNFVGLPSPEAIKAALGIKPFKRGPSASHEWYDPTLNTGYIECELTTHTPMFVPDARKVREQSKHKTLGYFTLQDVAAPWDAEHPAADVTRPAIPGTSLRGMVRSVFEAATLSCLSVFDAERLDFRIGYSPDHRGANVQASGRGKASYVPCRVTKCLPSGGLEIQRLVGKCPNDPDGNPVVIPVVLIPSYSPKVYNKTSHAVGTQQSDAFVATEKPVLVVCVKDVVRKVKERPDGSVYYPFRYRQSTQRLIPLTDPDSVDLDKISYDPNRETVIFGYFHRTGPNIENKHDERVFFRGDAPYNLPSGEILDAAQLRDRLNQFLADGSGAIRVRKEVVANTVTMLKGYSERLAKQIEAPAPRNLSAKTERPYPSDFVTKEPSQVEIREGNLFYALIEEVPDSFPDPAQPGNKLSQRVTVRGLYPVAIPRLTHDDTRGDLLPRELYPCGRRHEQCCRCADLSGLPDDLRKLCDSCQDSWRELCPACRVFGWTRDLSHYRREDRKALQGQSDRVDAVAGHVRFTHATLVGDWGNTDDRRARGITLKILSSPHPTTTGFYLEFLHPPGQERSGARDSRWPPVMALDDQRNPVARLPAYRQGEATLRGRKMYRRQEAIPAGGLEHDKQTEQNQTVHVLPPDLMFRFRVYFDNLTKQELAALIFSLQLQAPDDWLSAHGGIPANARLQHAVGHGKPLGMGRCTVDVRKIWTQGENPYADTGFHRVTDEPTTRPLTAADVQPFFDAWRELEADDRLVHMRSQLLDMLLAVPPGSPVRYPIAANPDGSANFFWWQDAKREGLTLPDPLEERTDPSKRLKQRLP